MVVPLKEIIGSISRTILVGKNGYFGFKTHCPVWEAPVEVSKESYLARVKNIGFG